MNQDEFDKLMQSFRKSMANYPYTFFSGMSPTDVDSKGMYEYQEPEVDEQGTYYGYKILHRCRDLSCVELISPRYIHHWDNGELTADLEPARNHMHGIHFTKRPDHPELRNYFGIFHGYSHLPFGAKDREEVWVLVKCALSGTIVETEQGFRAQHAQIIGVYSNGNWQSYQDYQGCTQADSRRIAQEEIEWKRYYYRDWSQASSYYDPPADS